MTSDASQARRALLSVSDKTGLAELAQGLHGLGYELISTGGTAAALARLGLPVTEVSACTGFPEMLDGRVKTLHPIIHAGLLARQELAAHRDTLQQHDIAPINLLVVNLYPFEATVAKVDCTFEAAIENIDIGGPAMVRSAAKNWRSVGVLTQPEQYGQALEELRVQGRLADATRLALARKAFELIARYDGAIAQYLSSLPEGQVPEPTATPQRVPFPAQLCSSYIKVQDLRYGENPHQQAAYYRDVAVAPGTLATHRQHQGKELSFNNLADADAAWECVRSFTQPACGIVKHANPCGVAIGENPLACYERAFSTDPTSAFGGIIAFNRPLDGATARRVCQQFLEVLMAPAYSDEALSILGTKPNIRVLSIEPASDGNQFDVKRIGSGLLVQTADNQPDQPEAWRVVTRRQPSPQELDDMAFAWRVARFVKSNAIVFCGKGMTLGIGAGQMSRVDSARIAGIKAGLAGLSLAGSAVASDAFFPFRDGLDVVIDAGATCVIQPGGSIRDEEVIAAANEREVCMVLTGTRHFRH